MKDKYKTMVDLLKEEIEHSENRFKLLFDSVFDAIIPVDEEENIVDVNQAACKLLGYSKEELLNLKAYDIHPPEEREKMRAAVRRLFQNRMDNVNEIQLLRKDGKILHAEAGAVVITIEGKDYCLGSFRDITKRKKAEEVSRLSEEKYRTLNNNLNVGVYRNTAGPKGKFIEVNPAFIKIFGYRSREELLSINVSDLYDNPEERKEYNEKILKIGFVNNEENIFKRNDGTTFIGSTSSVVVKGADGKVRYYDGIVEDITERKQAENALHEALSEINQLKEQIEAENIYLQEEIRSDHNFNNIIGQSHALKYVLFKTEQVAPTDTTVIILGETGSGKELIARAIHDASRRKDRTLVKVNCAALPPNLIESELFGHEKGAFTGAQTKRMGRFEVANGSTIFLDEIGELPLELQAKLLNVLESGELERLGSSRTIKVDVRIITATNRDLEKEVRKGRFRRDLWYRLNVFPITVPPLRKRSEDIPILVKFLIDRLNKKLGKQIEQVSKSAMKALMNFSWPGNVRELENVIERSVINSVGRTLRLVDKLDLPQTAVSAETPRKTLKGMERDYMEEILEETYWRIEGKNGAAAILDLNPSTFRARMRKLGINRPKARSLK